MSIRPVCLFPPSGDFPDPDFEAHAHPGKRPRVEKREAVGAHRAPTASRTDPTDVSDALWNPDVGAGLAHVSAGLVLVAVVDHELDAVDMAGLQRLMHATGAQRTGPS